MSKAKPTILKGPRSGSIVNETRNKQTSGIDWDNVSEIEALSITAFRTPVLAVPSTQKVGKFQVGDAYNIRTTLFQVFFSSSHTSDS